MTVTLDLLDHHDLTARKTLSALSLAVAKSKRVVIVTGAGISCSCGIPVRDFSLDRFGCCLRAISFR